MSKKIIVSVFVLAILLLLFRVTVIGKGARSQVERSVIICASGIISSEILRFASRQMRMHSMVGTDSWNLRWLLRLVGWPLVILPLVLLFEQDKILALLLSILGHALLIIAALLHGGRKLSMSRVLRAKDLPSRFVLYLRPFFVDREVIVPPISGMFVTQEEALIHALRPIGLVIAAGCPEEEGPEIGAARLYLGQSGWRWRIVEMISRSQLCVIVARPTPSIRWELAACVARLEPHRLLLVMPRRRRTFIETCKYLKDVIPKRIPEYEADVSFVAFGGDWKPQPIKLRPLQRSERSFWGGAADRTRQFELALGPFLDRLRIQNRKRIWSGISSMERRG